MGNMIGKVSKKDWSLAPKQATHYFPRDDSWYDASDLENVRFLVFSRRGNEHWGSSSCWYNASYQDKFISKEEDLGMDKKEDKVVTKQVRGVDDLELGMFLKSETGNVVVVTQAVGKDLHIEFFSCSNMANANVARNGAGREFYDKFNSWSYTYNGKYTPIVKETEAERKIKELEATIELAQKQLNELKEIK